MGIGAKPMGFVTSHNELASRENLDKNVIKKTMAPDVCKDEGRRMTDNDLVRECLVGKMESYKELMDRYRNHAMAIAVNILANREDAEEACQEAFLKAYRNLGGFDANRSYKNWFYALLSNHCLDMIRKRARFKGFLGRFRHENPAAVIAPPAPSASFEELDFRYLRPLKPKERTALFLWSQEGYSTAEIAAILGCSPSTAGVHLYRARVKLKTLLKEEKNARR
jgi:RNA polymerase sigma-70 factor (ECF subfamily)